MMYKKGIGFGDAVVLCFLFKAFALKNLTDVVEAKQDKLQAN